MLSINRQILQQKIDYFPLLQIFCQSFPIQPLKLIDYCGNQTDSRLIFCICPGSLTIYCRLIFQIFWRDIKFAFCLFLFVCTVEDISTQDGAIGVKFWLRVEQTPGTGTSLGVGGPRRAKKEANEIFVTMGVNGEFLHFGGF